MRPSYGLNLNIGSGDYHITDFVSLDLDSERYHANDKNSFINFDIRKDLLPYADSKVNNIYISHVIEHIENTYIENLFHECFRVLKKGGVLRISTPDAKFLYDVSQFKNSYWTWRKHWFEDADNVEENLDTSKLSQIDYFIKEIATPKSPYYKNKISNIPTDLDFNNYSYNELVNLLNKNLQFRYEFSGDHIKYWDFDKVYNLGQKCGFKEIINSKYLGSVSELMRRDEFDQKAVMMSLYVDLIK